MAKRLSIRPLSRLRSLLIVFLLLAVRSPASPATASDSPPNVAVLDFTVPADGSHTGIHGAAVGLGDLFQIELQRLGMVTLDRDSIHTVLSRATARGGRTDRRGLP